MRIRASSILLSLLPLTFAVSGSPALAQAQDSLRGSLPDTPIDTPAPRRRVQPQASADAPPAIGSTRGLNTRTTRGRIRSVKVAKQRPQDLYPNNAVQTPSNADVVALGLSPVQQPIRRRASPDDPYAPIGHRIGNLRLFIADDVTTGYDDNTALATGGAGKRPSFFVREGGELRLRSDWDVHELTSETTGGYSWYPSAREANRPDVQTRVGLRLDATRDTQIDIEARGKIDSQSPNSADLNFTPSERPLVYTYGGSTGVTQHFGRLVVNLRGSIDRTDYDDVSLGNGNILSQKTRDLTDYTARLRTGYELKPGLLPFIEVSADTRQYDTSVDDSGFRRSSKGGTARVGTSFEFTRTITGEASAGYGARTYDDARLDDLRGPVADASLIWAATPLTTATLRGASTFDETTLVGSSGSISRRISLDINHQLLRNLAIGAQVSYLDTDYEGIKRQDDTFGATLRAEYRFNRSFTARLGYTFQHNISTFTGQGYVSNIWTAGLKAEF